jgi:S1-C subfamily serine protease
VVVSVNGEAIDSAAQLRNAVGARRIGETVKLTLLRDGKSRSLSVKVAEPRSETVSASVHPLLEGATLQNDDSGRGVVVSQIAAGSPAARTRLRVGDVIVSANRRPVRNAAELKQAAGASKEQLLLRIVRGNAALFLVLQ